jgi:hypothetical protein
MAKSKELVIHIYNDPSHSWARVKRGLLFALGIQDKVTSFSYQNGQWVYLEEDCDAGLLVNALNEKGIPFSFKSHYCETESRIRSYASFRVDTE